MTLVTIWLEASLGHSVNTPVEVRAVELSTDSTVALDKPIRQLSCETDLTMKTSYSDPAYAARVAELQGHMTSPNHRSQHVTISYIKTRQSIICAVFARTIKYR